ncbi:MAG: hypothetical protein LBH94_03035 [Deltaproteobacteria bacterium]|jgi:tetratricopeptide (TPR) repeat protein|nr:hypothetical protein [Deltaproteobacteria bacterium]
MNEHVPAQGGRRILLLFLALSFLAMTMVSLWQRVVHPDLIVPSQSRQTSMDRDEIPAGAMSEIGQLMRQIKENPGDVAAMLHLAEHFMQEKNWAPAESFARKAVVAAPGNPQALYILAVILHSRGEHAEAASCLERVVDLRDDPSVRYSLGVIYARYLQEPARGGRHLRAALAQPGLPDDLAGLIRAELDAMAPKASTPKEADIPATTAPERKRNRPASKR